MAGQNSGFPAPGIGMPANLAAPHKAVDGRVPSSRAKLVQGALEGHVLVKNTNGALPLKAPKMVSVFGYSAKSPDWNNIDNWSGGDEPYVGGLDSVDLSAIAFNGTMYSGGGSGATSQSLVSSPMNALTNQCWDDDTEMFWDFTKNNPTIPASSDACIVMIK
jgi:beta-glucosidase